ncbi:MAG: hypothetical protein PHW75_01870 [Patescibacteria group bacterium]|nr:hypothetical protein [Patescibacteria group bacterium]
MNIKTNKKGSAWIGILLLLAFVATLGLALLADSILTIAQSTRASQLLVAQALCDAGIEKAIWELNDDSGYSGETDINLETGIIDIAVAGTSETKDVYVTSYVPVTENKVDARVKRTVRAKLTAENNEAGFAFHYGIQVGESGLSMSNNSQVIGNVYSGGSISGGNGAYIRGDVYVSATGGSIDNVRVGCPASLGGTCPIAGDAHVDNINYCYIYGDAFYQNIDNTTVLGTEFPGSETPPSIDLPIDATTIDLWKSWAATGGTYSGNYTQSANGVTVEMGPYKIDGDMTITNSSILELTGVLWVTGNVTFSNLAEIKLDPSFGPNSGMIIVDGTITTQNNVEFSGSGDDASYIMLLSTSSVDPAINVYNNSSSVVYYAANGHIDVWNNARIKSLTAEGINLRNGAIVEYDTGLASSNFSAGPGGAWVLKEWQIIYE